MITSLSFHLLLSSFQIAIFAEDTYLFSYPVRLLGSTSNYMANDGAFDGLDVCMHNHPMMENAVWNFHSTAAIDLWVEWQGVTAHAGASPWEGRSALHAAEIFLVAANMMREQMLPTARLHYQILSGGLAVNVIPDYAKVLIRYRGPSAENVLKYKKWLIDIAKGAALRPRPLRRSPTWAGSTIVCRMMFSQNA